MLHKANDILGYKLHAVDGKIGGIHDFLFDDEQWTVRYLVADTGLIFGRRVLISPNAAIMEPNQIEQQIKVNLTQEQIKKSPDLDTDAPISRRKEQEVRTYYGWPYYWNTGVFPGAGGYITPYPAQQVAVEDPQEQTHLRSMREVRGYTIHAIHGEIGHAEDFIFDEHWQVLYLVVDTRKWLPGKKVLVGIPWIRDISWGAREVTVGVTQEEIKNSPEYNGTTPVDRRYEERLYRH